MAQVDYGPDEWSDHDFFVIVESGAQEEFRRDFFWLPSPADIIFSFRETEHGVKVVYKNGHLLEFAVFDERELALARVNRFRVLFDRRNASRKMAEIREKTEESMRYSNDSDAYLFGQFITNILVGVGRYKRGERLSAHKFVKNSALHNLIILLSKHIDSENRHLSDNIDNLRRFEKVYPGIGAGINAMLLLDIPECARKMIELAHETLSSRIPGYPENIKDIVYGLI